MHILHKYRPCSNLAKYKLLHKRLYIPRSFQKRNLCSPPQRLFKTSSFYHVFTIFNSKWCVIFQIKTDLHIKSVEKMFLHTSHLTSSFISNKIPIFIAVIFRNIHFLPPFYEFWQCVNCVIIQINTNIFCYVIDLTSILHLKKILIFFVLKVFKTIHFFTTFLQVPGVAEMCDMSYVYHLSNMSAKYWYFYAKIPGFFSKSV